MKKALNETIKGRENRKPEDFYETPEFVTTALLRRESFSGKIIEPAAGNGAIVKVLRSWFHPERTFASDLIQYDFRLNDKYDFLSLDAEYRHFGDFCIITNPPFNSAVEFVLRADKIGANKAAFLLRTCFLESDDRFKMLFGTQSAGLSKFGLKKIYQFSKRISFSSDSKAASKIAFAWFVWERGFSGLPVVDWIPPEECKGAK